MLPGLSRRTGKPCRAVDTRQIGVRREGYQLAVAAQGGEQEGAGGKATKRME